eukprot:TRINITY_DN7091_c0_g1_i6.p1 TRINITY_DN7091_c0_g1~~TRINITY_DN7091_c0_g1_i6.p1  ORF type:complete len:688 (+),score=232.56 TRINITY_DN7091_c0_g1_i6:92-2155(+)
MSNSRSPTSPTQEGKSTVQMNEAQAAIKHLQDRAERAEDTCEALRKRNIELQCELDECRQTLIASRIEGDQDTVMVLAAKLEEAVSRVQELADEVSAKDMIIESLRDHLARHAENEGSVDTDEWQDHDLPQVVQGAAQEEDSEESAGPGSDEDEVDEEEIKKAEAVAADAMNMALLEAAFDCDIDVAARLHSSGAQLPELSSLVLDLQSRSIPAEMEATAVYVIEGLRSGSAEGEGATCALLEVLCAVWDQIPKLSSTVRAVCMVSDAEFCETEACLPNTLVAVERLAQRFAGVLISRSSVADALCEGPARVGTLRHEVLTFLGFVCGDVCQHVASWPKCISALHAAGVFHAALHNMFLFPQSSMVHVHVVSMLSGLLDHCVRVGEEAAEEGGTAPRTVAALVLQECAVLEQVLHRASGLCRQQLKGVLDQLVLMVHSAGLKCEEVAALEARTDGWLQHCTALLTAEQTQLASWTKLSSSETATHTPEPVLPSLIDPTDLLAVFDSIDGDGFGFAPRHDLLARVTQMSVDDSTLRFVVGSLEKMALKIVARDDFDAVVQQWKQLHSIMQDDDRDDSPEEESTASPPDSTADSTTGSPGGSPRSPGSILGMPGSPKGNHTAPVISTGNIDEVDERSPDKDKHSPNLSPAVSPAIDENSLSPAISPVPEIDFLTDFRTRVDFLIDSLTF